MMAKTWITAAEAARCLAVSMAALGELSARGALRTRRDGRHAASACGPLKGTLFRNEDIAAFARVFVRRQADGRLRELASQLSRACGDFERRSIFLALLTDQQRRIDNIIDLSHDGVWETDAAGHCTFLSPSAARLFGEPLKRLIGRRLFDFEAREKQFANRRCLARLRARGEVRDFITAIANGRRIRWLCLSARAFFDDAGRIEKVYGTLRDITEQHQAERQLRERSTRDPLTGLYNRSALIERLDSELRSGRQGAMLTVDIDYFDVVNEAFGPREGDAVIRALGAVLDAALRASDRATLFHLGGDRFAVVCCGMSRRRLAALGERLRGEISRYVHRSDAPVIIGCSPAGDDRRHAPGGPSAAGDRRHALSYTASAGVVRFPADGGTVLELMRNMRVTMAVAKQAGRDRLVFHEPPRVQRLRSATSRQSWYQRIQSALAEDRLELYAQPVCRLDDGTRVHQDVRVCLREDGRLLQPAEFLRHAEENGLIQRIDALVVQKTLSVVQSCRGAAPGFFINLSRVSVSDRGWVRQLLGMLRRARPGRTALVFGISEASALRDFDAVVRLVREVKSLGQALALADFSARLSTFDSLEMIDVDYIKIHGCAARDLSKLARRRGLLRAICEIARGLGKQVVAESIDDQATSRIFTESGAHLGQGCFFGHPAPIEAVLRPAGTQAVSEPDLR